MGTIGGTHVVYPKGLGATCRAWDDGRYPQSCTGDGAAFCAQKWCYVDPCNCELGSGLPKKSTYLADIKFNDKPLYMCYQTCGSEDLNPAPNTTEADLQALCGLKKAKDDKEAQTAE